MSRRLAVPYLDEKRPPCVHGSRPVSTGRPRAVHASHVHREHHLGGAKAPGGALRASSKDGDSVYRVWRCASQGGRNVSVDREHVHRRFM